MLSRHRRLAAILFLIIMAVNFTTEGYALYSPGIAGLMTHLKEAIATRCESSKDSCCSGTTECEEQPVVQSCCSQKPAATPQPASCGCPDCGDSCPMGAACTCSINGHGHTPYSQAMFFRAPTCHPEQQAFGKSYLPLSMLVVFIEAEKITSNVTSPLTDSLLDLEPQLTGAFPAPLVPPPQRPRA